MAFHHVVTVEELDTHTSEHREKWVRFAGSYGEGANKALEFQLNHVAPIYRVMDHDRCVYVGALKETAVREYNALP